MLARKIAIVTGSGKHRIGFHIAQALADLGYSLVLHYLSSKSEAEQTAESLQKRQVDAIALQADLSDETQVHALIQQTLDHFRRLDVLVNCASIWKPKKLEDITERDVREHFDANVMATFLCNREAGLAMVKQSEGGCIINFGDWAEKRPYHDYAAYFASKGAVPTLTRCLAVELGTRNPRVRVNCILPGPVMIPDDAAPEERQRAIQCTLVKREGQPEHIAQAVAFLIQNEFVTGICVEIDGGRTVFAGGF